MRTLAQKLKATQQTTSAKSTMPVRAHFGLTHKVNSILHLQSAVGNQAVLRLPEVNSEDVEGHNSSASGIARFGHDFSRISIYPGDRAEVAAQEMGAHRDTIGRSIGFGSSEYVAGGAWGKEVSTHEPVHTMDQRRPPSRGAGNEPPGSFLSSMPEAAPATAVQQEAAEGTTPATPTATSAATTLHWQHVKRHRWDALWYFCGEHPSGFSTTATLRAEGYTDPNNVEWFVRQGADKVYAPGGFNGPEITLHSSAGSGRPDDVHIEVRERMPGGAVTSYLGRLTVRKPHRLRQQWTSDHTSCPDPSLVSHPAIWTEISYRIIDNVGGTIIGATVNERFPSPAVNDQPNNWSSSPVTSTQSWPRTNGTFIDNLYMCGGTPAPVLPSSSHWSDKVYHMPHEFYVGSTTPGRGCRVQAHTLQFYRGFADHENIRSPAP